MGLSDGSLGEGDRLLRMKLQDGSSWSVGEEHPSDGLFSKLVNFSIYIGMAIVVFEKEIIFPF